MNADRAIGIGAFVTAGTILAAFAVFGLTLNTTPSYPRGLWRQVAVAEPPVIRGRMALACPPPAPAFEEAVRRGYMGGSAPAQRLRPIMKRIMAVAGDVVTFDGTGGAMRVNGEEIPNSACQPRGRSRPAAVAMGGRNDPPARGSPDVGLRSLLL